MQLTTEQSAIMQKTRELCQTILNQPEIASIRRRIETFLADDNAREQYEAVANKGQALQQKQQMAMPLNGEEIADFEQHREALLNNPVAKGFLEAQEEMHQVQHSIDEHVSKTLELGRVPGPEDFNSSCGHGCGCHH